MFSEFIITPSKSNTKTEKSKIVIIYIVIQLSLYNPINLLYISLSDKKSLVNRPLLNGFRVH